MYEAWVRKCGGTKVIRRLLVANNGMAAAKFILSIRNFLYQSFGDEQLIHIIAMATPEDMKASAKHLHLANAYYEVPGGPNFNNYANVSVITSMAKLHGCDAVWPGWGHASRTPRCRARATRWASSSSSERLDVPPGEDRVDDHRAVGAGHVSWSGRAWR